MTIAATIKSVQQIMRQDVGVDGDAQRILQMSWMLFLKIIDDQDQELEVMRKDYHSPIPTKLRWREWAANSEGITGDSLLNFVNNELFPKLKNLSVADNERCQIVRDVFADANNYMKSGQLMRQVINKIQTIDFNKLTERQHFGEIYEKILNGLQSAGNAGEFYTPRAITAFMAARLAPKPNEILLDPACGTGGFLTCAINYMRSQHINKPAQERKMQGNLRAVEAKHLPHLLCITNMLLHNVEIPSFVRHDDMLARPYASYTNADRVDVVLTNPPFGGTLMPGTESNFPRQFQTNETADLFLLLIMRLLKRGGRCGIVLHDGILFGEGVKTRLKKQLLETCNLHTIVRLPNGVFSPYTSIRTNLLFFDKGEPTKHVWYYEHQVPTGKKAYSMTRPMTLEHLQPCADWWDKRSETKNAWRVSIKEIEKRNYNLDIKNPNSEEMRRDNPQEMLEALEVSEQETADYVKKLHKELTGSLLQYAAKSSDAVPLLRRFILDIAARGKLVPQNPKDESATKLLERIAKEKRKLEKDGIIKQEKPLPSVDKKDIPFQIPDSWKWEQLGNILLYDASKKMTSNQLNPDKWLLELEDIEKNTSRLIQKVKIKERQAKSNKSNFIKGDVLYGKLRPYLNKVIIAEEDGYATTEIVSIRPYCDILPEYVVICLKRSDFCEYVTRLGQGTKMPRLRRGDAVRALFPLPPFTEQKRIVAKVNKLMALCDKLESSLTATQENRRRLLVSLLHTDSLDGKLDATFKKKLG